MILLYLDLQLPVQSVPIANVASLNTVHGEMYLIQHYVIKFVSDLWQASGFLMVLWFSPSFKLTWIVQGFIGTCICLICFCTDMSIETTWCVTIDRWSFVCYVRIAHSQDSVSEWSGMSTYGLLCWWAGTIKYNLTCWFSTCTKETSSSCQKITWFHHDIPDKLLIGVKEQSFTHAYFEILRTHMLLVYPFVGNWYINCLKLNPIKYEM
jgi:hypothetical protein